MDSLIYGFEGSQLLVWLFEGFYIIGLILYLGFAVVVIRQVEMMVEALGGLLKLPLRITAWGHLVATLLILSITLLLI